MVMHLTDRPADGVLQLRDAQRGRPGIGDWVELARAGQVTLSYRRKHE